MGMAAVKSGFDHACWCPRTAMGKAQAASASESDGGTMMPKIEAQSCGLWVGSTCEGVQQHGSFPGAPGPLLPCPLNVLGNLCR